MTAAQSLTAVKSAAEILTDLPEFSAAAIEAPMRELADELELKAGQLFGVLRIAVTAQKVSPPLFESMEIIGQQKVLERLRNASDLLSRLK